MQCEVLPGLMSGAETFPAIAQQLVIPVKLLTGPLYLLGQTSTCLLSGSVYCGREDGCEPGRDLGLSCLSGRVARSEIWATFGVGLAQWDVLGQS